MHPEPETHNPNPVDPIPDAAASSQPDIFNLGPPRNGKIAKLPKELRELINRMLADRAGGSAIIAALAERGISLNHENISNWKHGGFQDWLLEQDWQAEVNLQRESALDLFDSGDATKFQQAVIQLAVTQIFKALKKSNFNNDPSNYTRLLNSLSRLAREAVVMKKYADFSAREKLRELKELDPNRDLSDQEHQLWYGKVEEFFRLKPGTLSRAAADPAHQTQSPETAPSPLASTPGLHGNGETAA